MGPSSRSHRAMTVLISAAACHASTYNLLYDGIVSAGVASSFASNPAAPSSVPYELVTDLSTSIAGGIMQILSVPDSSIASDEITMEFDKRCYQSQGGGGRCTIEYAQQIDVSLHVATQFFTQGESVALRMDVELTTSDARLSRDSLVRSVPMVNHQIGSFSGSVWSIQERLSAVEMKASWDSLATVSATQLERESRAGSFDDMILSKNRMRNRRRLESANTYTPDPTAHSLELWQYDDVDHARSVKALFLDGQMQATTSPVGAAHVEALVHPALVAHLMPERVAIISLAPAAIVKEVLKHKLVQAVSVIGLDNEALDMIQRHMPTLLNCSFLLETSTSCMNQPKVEVKEGDVLTWLRLAVAAVEASEGEGDPYYDVIVVDVPSGNDEWLTLDFHTELKKLLDDDSILVIGAGSAPSLFDSTKDDSLSPRDIFLRQSTRPVEHGGLEYAYVIHYDEPLAKPLASTFISLFKNGLSSSYTRFIRRNAPFVDLDIVERFHGGISPQGLPTVIYDGPTHSRYMNTPREWENWYCKTKPGKNLPICSFLPSWFDPTFHHYTTEVRKHPTKGRALYATEDIPAGHFMLPHDMALRLHLEKDQWDALNKFVDDFPEAVMYRQVRDFILAYGFESEVIGQSGWAVSIACNNTFTNHGCSAEEQNLDWMRSAFEAEDDGSDQLGFSPIMTRRPEVFGMLSVTNREIKAGEEIMFDYAAFRTFPEEEYIDFLNVLCSEGVGLVPLVDEGALHASVGKNVSDEL